MKKKAVTKNKRIFRDYQEKLIEDLQNPEMASAYLNAALEDEDPRIFLVALKNVHEALGVPIEELDQTIKNQSKSSSKKGSSVLAQLVGLMKASHITLSLNLPKK